MSSDVPMPDPLPTPQRPRTGKMKKVIKVMVELTLEGHSLVTYGVIERGTTKDGYICFDGKWVKPEMRGDVPTVFVQLPHALDRKAENRNQRCIDQLIMMTVDKVLRNRCHFCQKVEVCDQFVLPGTKEVVPACYPCKAANTTQVDVADVAAELEKTLGKCPKEDN